MVFLFWEFSDLIYIYSKALTLIVCVEEFVAHSQSVNCLKIGRKSSRVLVTGGEDHKVNLWAIGKPNAILVGFLFPPSFFPFSIALCFPYFCCLSAFAFSKLSVLIGFVSKYRLGCRGHSMDIFRILFTF